MPEFQFHSGSIKTDWHKLYHAAAAQFQFHSGSIKTVFAVVTSALMLVSIPLWFD